jgi:hypothetical protein
MNFARICQAKGRKTTIGYGKTLTAKVNIIFEIDSKKEDYKLDLEVICPYCKEKSNIFFVDGAFVIPCSCKRVTGIQAIQKMEILDGIRVCYPDL